MKYIKYLISLLLILGLTVNDCSIYSAKNSASYNQVSYANTRKGFSHKHTKLCTYGKRYISEIVFSTLLSFRNLRDAYSIRISAILKLQIEVYQEINSMIVQHIFLSKIITSSNQYPSLYIA